ncbi:MAG: nickel-dependent lactate racemase [Bacteroidota bacterium]
MRSRLAYGPGMLELDLQGIDADIIEPRHNAGLPDEKEAVVAALHNPVGTRPLESWLNPSCRICISFTDGTRATPNNRLIPWLLEYLHRYGVQRENIKLLNQVGTHRANTRDELKEILTPEIVEKYQVINHEPNNREALVQLGVTRSGAPALVNRHFVEADVRIATGFIEPHLFAGFSGGVKNIIPGLAGQETVMHNHGYRNLLDPHATFGVTEGNPLWEELRDIALRTGPVFLLNVALNNDRHITGVFAGDLLESHKVGCEFVRSSAMQRVDEQYDVVITTNSGYPLDQNLYQSVKGMSAAARIVAHGGTIILAAECREGFPAGSAYERLLRNSAGPAELLQHLRDADRPFPDQWQAQIQALILQRAEILLYSQMSDEDVRAAHLSPCHDIARVVRRIFESGKPDARVAILPQGPLTIPYLAQEVIT